MVKLKLYRYMHFNKNKKPRVTSPVPGFPSISPLGFGSPCARSATTHLSASAELHPAKSQLDHSGLC